MKCLFCNTDKEMEIKRENFNHLIFGTEVTLINIEVARCLECGEFEVIIPKLGELNDLLKIKDEIKSTRLNLYFQDGWKIENDPLNTNKENT